MHEFVSLAPGDLQNDKLYACLVAAVQPRPIAFVSTADAAGRPNLAPFSFFMLGGVNPPSLMFSVTMTPEGHQKDTLRNIEETGEFVVNTVHRAMAEGMNAASYGYDPGSSEWDATGFQAIPSDQVSPARVAESYAQFECRKFNIVRHGSGPGAANYVIGEIVRMHIAEHLWDRSSTALRDMRLLARLGGPMYLDCEALEIFAMQRPSAPIEL